MNVQTLTQAMGWEGCVKKGKDCLLFLGLFVACSLSFTSWSFAQDATIEDYMMLRINEIVADNDDIEPFNWRCKSVDMIEIYNGSSKALTLGPTADSSIGVIRITDGSLDENGKVRYLDLVGGEALGFNQGTGGVKNLLAGQRLIIFCDEDPYIGTNGNNRRTAECIEDRVNKDEFEVHANFRLDNDGELLTLERVPEVGADPEIIHQVQYPPLNRDVSYSRYPEDVDNLDAFVFNQLPPGPPPFPTDQGPSMGKCTAADPEAITGISTCLGSPNNPGDPIAPNIEMIDYSTNSPRPGEEVMFRVRITDEKLPDEQNITSVRIRYRTDGTSTNFQTADCQFIDLLEDANNPIEKWSIWEGAIPGSVNQLGETIEFYFEVTDQDDLVDTNPGVPICDIGIGPCNGNDLLSEIDPESGCNLGDDCGQAFQYTVTEVSDIPIVINEVVPNNRSILKDPTEEVADCNVDDNCLYDDFIELYNSQALNVNIADLVLARGAFRPSRGWAFGSGSLIGPKEHLIVWVDGDGKDPVDADDKPNPNNFAQKEYHTDFTLDASRDEIFLFKKIGDNDYQLISGVRWGTSGRYFESRDLPAVVDPLPLARNEGVRESLSGDVGTMVELGLARFPDGDPSANFNVLNHNDIPITPKEPNNPGPGTQFRRGDVNGDGGVDVTDPISNLQFQFLGIGDGACQDAMDFDDNGKIEITDPIGNLSYQFLGSGFPADPGPVCGSDPTEDELPECLYPSC